MEIKKDNGRTVKVSGYILSLVTEQRKKKGLTADDFFQSIIFENNRLKYEVRDLKKQLSELK